MTRSESFESDRNLGVHHNSCACSLKVTVKIPPPDTLYSLSGVRVEALEIPMGKSTPTYTIHQDADGTGEESQSNREKHVSFSLKM